MIYGEIAAPENLHVENTSPPSVVGGIGWAAFNIGPHPRRSGIEICWWRRGLVFVLFAPPWWSGLEWIPLVKLFHCHLRIEIPCTSAKFCTLESPPPWWSGLKLNFNFYW